MLKIKFCNGDLICRYCAEFAGFVAFVTVAVVTGIVVFS